VSFVALPKGEDRQKEVEERKSLKDLLSHAVEREKNFPFLPD